MQMRENRPQKSTLNEDLTFNVPEKLQLYGLHVYYVVHMCDFGMLRVNGIPKDTLNKSHGPISTS